MKVLLVIFVFYIHYVTSASDKYAVKSFPKKVKPYGTGKILIHSGKYIPKPKSQKTTAKVNGKNGKYTVFQVVGNSKAVQGVPDSPYFPVDQTIDQKPRVKKVLPDYVWSSLGTRHKREATEEAKTENTPETTSENKTDTKPTVEPSTEKPKEEPKSDKNETKIEKAEFRASDKDSNNTTSIDTKKLETNVEKKEETNTESQKEASQTSNPVTNATKSVGTTKKGVTRKGKNKSLVRNNSKKAKSNKAGRAKPRTRGKSPARNGTALKKSKGGNRQGRSKAKSKQNKTGHPLRKPKSQKRSKASKSAKKNVVRKGNSTNIKFPKETRRLTAAREALIEDYPYVVSLQKDSEHWCTGALLNPRLVITTANCLWKSNHLSRMEVRACSTYTDHGGTVASIQEVIKHPRWGLRKNPDNDLALVLLDRNIRFSHSCHGVDLPNRVMMPSFEDAWIVSWGAERRDGIFDMHENGLQVYHNYLMSKESCNNVTRRFGISVTDNFICFSQSGKTAPCTRDTGAPAVSDGVLWGLASWGIRKLCGTERFPAMFSYTASHSNMDFIANTTVYMMSDERFYPFVDRPPVARVAKPADTTPA